MATHCSVHQLLKKAHVTVKGEFRLTKISFGATHVTDPIGTMLSGMFRLTRNKETLYRNGFLNLL